MHLIKKKKDRYYSPYKVELCDLLIKHMAQGLSFESFGVIAKVGRRTLFNWVKKHPDFEEAKEIGASQSMALFEKLLISKAMGAEILTFNGKLIDPKKIDITAVIFWLKTRSNGVYSEKLSGLLGDEDGINIIVKKFNAPT